MKTISAIFMILGAIIWLITMIAGYRLFSEHLLPAMDLSDSQANGVSLGITLLILAPICFLISSIFLFLSIKDKK
tara:strand:- start:363 stop:587 length:225 start_codon:yes stop_codon:yes gene_type:complete